MVALDHLRQKVIHGRRHAGNRHLAHAARGHVAQAHEHAVQVIQPHAGLARKVTAHGRERDTAGGAVKQAHAQGFFELVDATAEGRLRQVDRLGRSTKALQLSHRGKGLDVSKIEFVVHGHGLSRRFAVAQHASNDQNIAIHERDFTMYKGS